MNEQLKEKFEKEYKKVWENSTSMQNYCIKKLSNGVQLENGLLIEFEKPSIKKNFCQVFKISKKASKHADLTKNTYL